MQRCLGRRVCVGFQGRRVDTVNGTDLYQWPLVSTVWGGPGHISHIDDPCDTVFLLSGTEQGKSLLRDSEDSVDVQVHDLFETNGK